MNAVEMEIIKQLSLHPFRSQRELASSCACSLGMVNRCLKSLEGLGYLTAGKQLTTAAEQLLKESKPERAVILAAGVGMRMVPVNMEQPKAMLEVNGEILIERMIRQLREAGIREIHVVVGFMKEAFEYLIDDFGVDLIVNRDYCNYNNLHSLALAKGKLSNAYILPSDVWCRSNPFSPVEISSWYMVKNTQDYKSEVRVNRRQELVPIRRGDPGNPMVGICYITRKDSRILERNLENLCQNFLYDHAFWEEALYENGIMLPLAKMVAENQVIEINTYRQLQDLKTNAAQKKADAVSFLCRTLCVQSEEIRDVRLLKNGMTNLSFLFTCRNRRYVLRIPSGHADLFVDRIREQEAYLALNGKKLSDDVIAMDTEAGYKLTRFLENARSCDPTDQGDVEKCMEVLRNFHNTGLSVQNRVDLYQRISFYEKLWQGKASAYRDYETTKKNVFSLSSYLEAHQAPPVLTHLDAVPDNFLFYEDADGDKKLRLIDWECAAMQDPHVDIAMFCIGALYTKSRTDRVIDLYFENNCPPETRIKIYCYIAVCGLMWSNWCEYQMQNGAEFGEYSLKQYRYAKEYYRYAMTEIPKLRSDT